VIKACELDARNTTTAVPRAGLTASPSTHLRGEISQPGAGTVVAPIISIWLPSIMTSWLKVPLG